MWDQMTAEAKRLCADDTPKSEAVASLIALVGNNPRAFGGIGGRSTKGLHRTTEGQAVLRLLSEAYIEYGRLSP